MPEPFTQDEPSQLPPFDVSEQQLYSDTPTQMTKPSVRESQDTHHHIHIPQLLLTARGHDSLCKLAASLLGSPLSSPQWTSTARGHVEPKHWF